MSVLEKLLTPSKDNNSIVVQIDISSTDSAAESIAS